MKFILMEPDMSFKLPFKTDHDLLLDNFEAAKIQLQNLKPSSKIMKSVVLLKGFFLMRYLRILGLFVPQASSEYYYDIMY